MKTVYVRFLSAFFALAAFAAAARAQSADQLTVNIPYEFVVSGKTLPAGTYRINRVNDRDIADLAIFGTENHTSALLHSSEVTSATENKPTLSFEHIGNQYFLSKVETADHVFTLPVPTKQAVEVAMKKQSSPSASGSSGSN